MRLEEKAASLFMLVENAFGRGKIELREELTALALRYLDEAHAVGTVFPPSATEPERPAV